MLHFVAVVAFALYQIVPKPGLQCPGGGTLSARGIGDPIIVKLGEPDVRGRKGNEIKRIARVDFAAKGTVTPEVAGWLFYSFNRRAWYQSHLPALAGGFLPVPFDSPVSGATLARWTARLATDAHASSDPQLMKFEKMIALSSTRVSAARCFERDWQPE